MKYENIVMATFLSRPNRFIAEVQIGENVETVHVKNTGRCEELLVEGVKVILEPAANPERKTKYDLIAVFRENYGWINIDSQAPNQVVKEWLESGNSSFGNLKTIKPEHKYHGSRIDFYLEKNDENSKILLEVKGCTLIKGGIAMFPDAPTDRGVKHLEELTEAAEDGYECYIAFVIQVNGYKKVIANRETQPKFGLALRNALQAGVKIIYLACDVTENVLEAKSYNVKESWESMLI